MAASDALAGDTALRLWTKTGKDEGTIPCCTTS